MEAVVDPNQMKAAAFVDDDKVISARLSAYLGGDAGRLKVIGLRRFPAGFSWLTYEVNVESPPGKPAAPLILRIGSPHGALAPYTARPEYLALRALEGSAVPVPRALWYSDDESIMGAPFIIQEKMPGHTTLSYEMSTRPESDRLRLAHQFTDILAALHKLDWTATAVAPLGENLSCADAALRQIEFWEERAGRWEARPTPMLAWTFQWLRAHRPPAERLTIVHGDYRVGNFLEADRRISAILDWEFTHIGDPVEDLGWAVLRDFAGGKGRLVGGLISREAMLERYQEATGIAVTAAALEYYEIFAKLKLTIVYLASLYRFAVGGSSDIRMATLGQQLPMMLRQLGQMIEEAR